jgi:hypothetical protein
MAEPSTYPEFPLECFKFLFRVTHSIILPQYKGSTFHGGFSHALDRIGRRFRDYFFHPRNGKNENQKKALPKPFMLIPPLEEKTKYHPGDEMQCGLILFGEAIQHFMIAFAALEKLGQELGLGRNEGHFEIKSVEQIALDGTIPLFKEDRWLCSPSPICAIDILSANQIKARLVTLLLATRLRLKNNDQLVRKTPEFPIFFDRLIGRINSLSALYGNGKLMPTSQKDSMLRAAENVKTQMTATKARWEDWTRPSKPGREKMCFGGLLGQIVYTGELTPFIPWLALGQWTGIGGKTSFGLGFYYMDLNGIDYEIS